jgi:hypothetical protein
VSRSAKTFIIALAICSAIFGLVGGYKWLTSSDQSQAPVSYSSAATPLPLDTPDPTIVGTPQPTPAPQCYSGAQAANEIGTTGCVEFTVGYTYTSSKCNAYLDQYTDYSSGFEVWIPDGCGLGTTLLSEYAGKTIDVSGTISNYEGAPEIQVTSASQIVLAP